MRKGKIIIALALATILSGCSTNETTINFNNFNNYEKETTTFAPVNEAQHYSNYTQVNITELEGLTGITEADIFIPIPNDAVWDFETKTFTIPDNYINENEESFIMTILLEPLSEELRYLKVSTEVKEEVEKLKNQDRIKYGGSGYIAESNVVVKNILITELEEPSSEEDEEATTEKLKKTVIYTIDAYDFLAPTYYLQIQVEIVKLRGTVDDTTNSYFSALDLATSKFKLHYQKE